MHVKRHYFKFDKIKADTQNRFLKTSQLFMMTLNIILQDFTYMAKSP